MKPTSTNWARLEGNIGSDITFTNLPNEEETPPVTNMYFVVFICPYYTGCKCKDLLVKQRDKY